MVMVAMVHASVCFGEGGERCGDERNLKHRSKTRQRTEEEVEHYRAKDADWTDAVSSCLCPILVERFLASPLFALRTSTKISLFEKVVVLIFYSDDNRFYQSFAFTNRTQLSHRIKLSGRV